MIEFVKTSLGGEGPIYHNPTAGQVSHTYGFSSNRIREVFATVGIVPRKTYTIKFPEILPDHLFSYFIRGCIDGDGCVGIYDNGRGIKYLNINIVGTRGLMEGCERVCPVRGRIKSEQRPNMNLWSITWTGKTAVELGKWAFEKTDGLFESRKFKKFWTYVDSGMKTTKWFQMAQSRDRVYQLLAQKIPPMEVSRITGVQFQTIYKWLEISKPDYIDGDQDVQRPGKKRSS